MNNKLINENRKKHIKLSIIYLTLKIKTFKKKSIIGRKSTQFEMETIRFKSKVLVNFRQITLLIIFCLICCAWLAITTRLSFNNSILLWKKK